MKTLFLYRNNEMEAFFFEKEGDFSHLNGLVVNMSENEKLIDELLTLLYGSPEGSTMVVEKLEAPTKDWAWFVTVGEAL